MPLAIVSGSRLHGWAPPEEPDFPLNEWVNITPAGLTTGDQNTWIGQGLARCPTTGALYACNGPFVSGGGLYKSTDNGSNWTRVGNVTPWFGGASDYITNPVQVRVNPNNPDELYCVCGVRGDSLGAFKSTDGGVNFTRMAMVLALATANSIAENVLGDCYDIAPDPDDWDHILISGHSGWGGGYGGNSGLMESFDGGATGALLAPGDWGTGHAINFLYRPDLEVGDADTWLLGTQGSGWFRTTNAGGSWTQVSENFIAHGGQQIYYTDAGVLYAPGYTNTLKSTDNGANWTTALAQESWSVYGDGTTLYTGPQFTEQPVSASLESSGTSWGALDSVDFVGGPFAQQVDRVGKVRYCNFWHAGVWARRYE
jgi:hypothetical protein